MTLKHSVSVGRLTLPAFSLWFGIFISVGVGIYYLHHILMPFVISFIMAYLLNPMVTYCQEKGMGRPLAAFLIVIGVFACILTSILISIPFLKEQLLKLAYTLPRFSRMMYGYIEPYILQVQNFLDVSGFESDEPLSYHLSKVTSWAFQAAANVLTNTVALANLLSLVILIPLITFYLLRDWVHIVTTFHKLLPPKHALQVILLLERINKTLKEYFRGQALVCLTLFIYYSIALSLIGLKFSILIALVTGFFAFIPYVGYLTGVLVAMGVALSQFQDWSHLSLVLGVFLIGQLIESYYLLPKMVGMRIGLHPVWIIFALLAGGALMGFSGLLFSMPLAATLGVLIRHTLHAYRQSIYYIQ